MSIQVDAAGTNDEAAIVRVDGAVSDGPSATELQKALQELIARGKVRTIVDLSNVSWFDSVGIGLLVSHYVSVTNRSGKVVLLGASDKVKTLFEITRLLDRFDWASDLDGALELLGARSGTA